MLGMRVLIVALALLPCASHATDPYPGYDMQKAIGFFKPYLACATARAREYARAQGTTATEVATAAIAECASMHADAVAALREYTIAFNAGAGSNGVPLDQLTFVDNMVTKKAQDLAVSAVVKDRASAQQPANAQQPAHH